MLLSFVSMITSLEVHPHSNRVHLKCTQNNKGSIPPPNFSLWISSRFVRRSIRIDMSVQRPAATRSGSSFPSEYCKEKNRYITSIPCLCLCTIYCNKIFDICILKIRLRISKNPKCM